MNSIYFNAQRIVHQILKYKDDLRRKEEDLIFKYLEIKNR